MRYIKKRTLVERVVIVCPMEERRTVVDEIADEWQLVGMGPYQGEEMVPKLDLTQFRIELERIVKEDGGINETHVDARSIW